MAHPTWQVSHIPALVSGTSRLDPQKELRSWYHWKEHMWGTYDVSQNCQTVPFELIGFPKPDRPQLEDCSAHRGIEIFSINPPFALVKPTSYRHQPSTSSNQIPHPSIQLYPGEFSWNVNEICPQFQNDIEKMMINYMWCLVTVPFAKNINHTTVRIRKNLYLNAEDSPFVCLSQATNRDMIYEILRSQKLI